MLLTRSLTLTERCRRGFVTVLALTALLGCGGRGNSSIDDFDDADDIVVDDADDTTDNGNARRVRRYTQGREVPGDILDPKYLSRANLAQHLKPELAGKDVEFNINKRLDFSTRLFFPEFCLYRGVKLKKSIAFTYTYDTGINERCRPEGEDISRYEAWEKGEITVSPRHQPKDGQTLSDYWFELLEKIRAGKDVDIDHRFKRTLLMDYRERGFELRKSQLTTQSTLGGRGCEYRFNGAFAGQEISSCVRQTGVRIWDRDSGENGISDFVRFYNPDDLVAEQTFEFQPWFNAGSGFDINVNTWQGKLMFNQLGDTKRTKPRAVLENPEGRSIEFEPKPGATLEALTEAMRRSEKR